MAKSLKPSVFKKYKMQIYIGCGLLLMIVVNSLLTPVSEPVEKKTNYFDLTSVFVIAGLLAMLWIYTKKNTSVSDISKNDTTQVPSYIQNLNSRLDDIQREQNDLKLGNSRLTELIVTQNKIHQKEQQPPPLVLNAHNPKIG